MNVYHKYIFTRIIEILGISRVFLNRIMKSSNQQIFQNTKLQKNQPINIVNEARTFTPLCRYMGMLGIEVAYTDSWTYNSLMKGTHCHLQLCLNCFYRLVKISIIGTLRNKETKDGKNLLLKITKCSQCLVFMDTHFKS